MNNKIKPTLGYSLLTLATVIGFTCIGIMVWGAPLNVMMFLNWLVISALAYKLGYTYDDLETSALNTLRTSFQSIIILFAVGGLIGTWIASGTVPTIIYYGLKIMSAKYFLFTTLIFCSMVSVSTGTSWGTLGTVGVALMGIGAGLGVPMGMTAGAIISGAWFGDKMSPLSDTTNFASAIVGTNVMTHVKHMMYTTGPAYLLTSIIFLGMGFMGDVGQMDYTLINEISSAIEGTFNLGIIPFIPMVVVIYLFVSRKSPAMSILIGAVMGIVLAIFYQNMESSIAFKSLYSGYNGSFDTEFLTKLLNRGGIKSMLGTAVTMIFTIGLGGMMREIGVIQVIVESLSKKIKTSGGLVFAAMSVNYLSQMLTGSHYFAAVMTNSTMLNLFKSKRLKPENVSRVIEDCGTIGGTLIPWSVTAAYVMTTIDIPFAEYAPYALLCYLTPIFTLISGITGFGMAKYEDNEIVELS